MSLDGGHGHLGVSLDGGVDRDVDGEDRPDGREAVEEVLAELSHVGAEGRVGGREEIDLHDISFRSGFHYIPCFLREKP